MVRNAGQILDEALLENYDEFRTKGGQGTRRIIRCHRCMDSDNRNHAHLSITLEPPFYFLCQRCRYSGAVNVKFLEERGVRITPVLREILELNKAAVAADMKSRGLERTRSLNRYVTSKASGMKTPVLYGNDIKKNFLYKYMYICDRFKRKYTIPELELFKVVFDLKKFLLVNYIQELPAEIEEMDRLQDKYTGFMTNSGSIVNRLVIDSDDCLRYYDLRFNKSGFRMYNFKSEINLCEPRIRLAVAEGVFDLIGLYSFNSDLLNTHIFVAMLGHGLASIINYFMKLGFLEISIDLFSDNDVTSKELIMQLWKMNLPKDLNISVSFITNTINQDFGVEPSLIKPSRPIKIWGPGSRGSW